MKVVLVLVLAYGISQGTTRDPSYTSMEECEAAVEKITEINNRLSPAHRMVESATCEVVSDDE